MPLAYSAFDTGTAVGELTARRRVKIMTIGCLCEAQHACASSTVSETSATAISAFEDRVRYEEESQAIARYEDVNRTVNCLSSPIGASIDTLGYACGLAEGVRRPEIAYEIRAQVYNALKPTQEQQPEADALAVRCFDRFQQGIGPEQQH